MYYVTFGQWNVLFFLLDIGNAPLFTDSDIALIGLKKKIVGRLYYKQSGRRSFTESDVMRQFRPIECLIFFFSPTFSIYWWLVSDLVVVFGLCNYATIFQMISLMFKILRYIYESLSGLSDGIRPYNLHENAQDCDLYVFVLLSTYNYVRASVSHGTAQRLSLETWHGCLKCQILRCI